MGVQSVARRQHRLEEAPRVRDEAELGREVLADHGRIDGHMDELGTWADEPIGVGNETAELGPDGKDQVRVAHGGVGVVARVAPDAAQGQLVRFGDAALARTARGNRDSEPLGRASGGRRGRRTDGYRCRR